VLSSRRRPTRYVGLAEIFLELQKQRRNRSNHERRRRVLSFFSRALRLSLGILFALTRLFLPASLLDVPWLSSVITMFVSHQQYSFAFTHLFAQMQLPQFCQIIVFTCLFVTRFVTNMDFVKLYSAFQLPSHNEKTIRNKMMMGRLRNPEIPARGFSVVKRTIAILHGIISCNPLFLVGFTRALQNGFHKISL